MRIFHDEMASPGDGFPRRGENQRRERLCDRRRIRRFNTVAGRHHKRKRLSMTQGNFRHFMRFATSGTTVKRAFKVACIITPILTILNHAHEIIALDLGPRFFLQVCLTFCVPYSVSTYSSAMTELKNAKSHGELAQ